MAALSARVCSLQTSMTASACPGGVASLTQPQPLPCLRRGPNLPLLAAAASPGLAGPAAVGRRRSGCSGRRAPAGTLCRAQQQQGSPSQGGPPGGSLGDLESQVLGSQGFQSLAKTVAGHLAGELAGHEGALTRGLKLW